MKLSSDQISRIHVKKGIDPLPGDYPAMSELIKVFGEPTFYLTADGLHIWNTLKFPVLTDK